MSMTERQNITISLNTVALRKARVLAARRATSISGLLAQELERLVNEEEAYEAAHRVASDLMTRGLRLGGELAFTRDEMHAR